MHRRCRITLALAIPLSLAAIACGQQPKAKAKKLPDWSQFRGPAGMAVSKAPGVPVTWSADENVVWKTELPGAGTSTPILVGPRIFLTCYSGFGVPGGENGGQEDLRRTVVCLNRSNGEIAWQREVESKLPEQESIRDEHGYASNSPVCDGRRLYVFFGKSGVFAFDLEGNQLWQTDVGSQLNGWGSAASLVLHGDVVIVNASVESQSLIALNKETGTEVWRADGINESWNTPILIKNDKGQTELVLAIMGKVLGYDPTSGQQLWSCDTDIGWYMVPSLVADKGIVYCIGGRSGGALAVKAGGKGDVTRSHRLWTGTKGSNVSSPIFHEGRIYWMNDNSGIAYCADAETGEIIYEERVSGAGQIYASPVLADGKLYYVSREGQVYVIAAKPEFELLATNELEYRGVFNAGMAVAGNRLYLRSNRFLYCLGQK